MFYTIPYIMFESTFSKTDPNNLSSPNLVCFMGSIGPLERNYFHLNLPCCWRNYYLELTILIRLNLLLAECRTNRLVQCIT